MSRFWGDDDDEWLDFRDPDEERPSLLEEIKTDRGLQFCFAVIAAAMLYIGIHILVAVISHVL